MVKQLEKSDHVVRANNKFLFQHRESNDFKALNLIIAQSINDVEDQIELMQLMLPLPFAKGANLDYWGDLFNVPNRPVDDEDYRLLIYSFIFMYYSEGNAGDVRNSLLTALSCTEVHVFDTDNGSFSATLYNPKIPLDLPLLNKVIELSTATGVGTSGVTLVPGQYTYLEFDESMSDTLQVEKGPFEYWETYTFEDGLFGSADDGTRIYLAPDRTNMKLNFITADDSFVRDYSNNPNYIRFTDLQNNTWAIRYQDQGGQQLTDSGFETYLFLQNNLEFDQTITYPFPENLSGNLNVIGVVYGIGTTEQTYDGLQEIDNLSKGIYLTVENNQAGLNFIAELYTLKTIKFYSFENKPITIYTYNDTYSTDDVITNEIGDRIEIIFKLYDEQGTRNPDLLAWGDADNSDACENLSAPWRSNSKSIFDSYNNDSVLEAVNDEEVTPSDPSNRITLNGQVSHPYEMYTIFKPIMDTDKVEFLNLNPWGLMKTSYSFTSADTRPVIPGGYTYLDDSGVDVGIEAGHISTKYLEEPIDPQVNLVTTESYAWAKSLESVTAIPADYQTLGYQVIDGKGENPSRDLTNSWRKAITDYGRFYFQELTIQEPPRIAAIDAKLNPLDSNKVTHFDVPQPGNPEQSLLFANNDGGTSTGVCDIRDSFSSGGFLQIASNAANTGNTGTFPDEYQRYLNAGQRLSTDITYDGADYNTATNIVSPWISTKKTPMSFYDGEQDRDYFVNYKGDYNIVANGFEQVTGDLNENRLEIVRINEDGELEITDTVDLNPPTQINLYSSFPRVVQPLLCPLITTRYANYIYVIYGAWRSLEWDYDNFNNDRIMIYRYDMDTKEFVRIYRASLPRYDASRFNNINPLAFDCTAYKDCIAFVFENTPTDATSQGIQTEIYSATYDFESENMFSNPFYIGNRTAIAYECLNFFPIPLPADPRTPEGVNSKAMWQYGVFHTQRDVSGVLQYNPSNTTANTPYNNRIMSAYGSGNAFIVFLHNTPAEDLIMQQQIRTWLEAFGEFSVYDNDGDLWTFRTSFSNNGDPQGRVDTFVQRVYDFPPSPDYNGEFYGTGLLVGYVDPNSDEVLSGMTILKNGSEYSVFNFCGAISTGSKPPFANVNAADIDTWKSRQGTIPLLTNVDYDFKIDQGIAFRTTTGSPNYFVQMNEQKVFFSKNSQNQNRSISGHYGFKRWPGGNDQLFISSGGILTESVNKNILPGCFNAIRTAGNNYFTFKDKLLTLNFNGGSGNNKVGNVFTFVYWGTYGIAPAFNNNISADDNPYDSSLFYFTVCARVNNNNLSSTSKPLVLCKLIEGSDDTVEVSTMDTSNIDIGVGDNDFYPTMLNSVPSTDGRIVYLTNQAPMNWTAYANAQLGLHTNKGGAWGAYDGQAIFNIESRSRTFSTDAGQAYIYAPMGNTITQYSNTELIVDVDGSETDITNTIENTIPVTDGQTIKLIWRGILDTADFQVNGNALIYISSNSPYVKQLDNFSPINNKSVNFALTYLYQLASTNTGGFNVPFSRLRIFGGTYESNNFNNYISSFIGGGTYTKDDILLSANTPTTITHNLGTKLVVLRAYTGYTTFPIHLEGSVKLIDENTLTLETPTNRMVSIIVKA